MSSYRLNYGLGDFIKILFYKKQCPICKRKLKRKSEKKEYIETDQYMISKCGRGAYDITIYYVCENCNKRVEVSEI